MVSFRYSTRFVILFNDVVVKIPICKKGFAQGYNEQKIWNKYKHTAPLAELKFIFLGVVCQKRYATVESIPSLVVRRIKSKVPEFNFDNCDLRNPQNWGIEGKTYILLDYGINEKIASLY
jgi:hypothetical protein